MMASAPALAAALASASVVAVANHAIPRSFSRLTKPAGNTPIMDETAVGDNSRNVSHCALKSGRDESPADGGTSGPHAFRNSRILSSAARSLFGFRPGIQRFN